jgi:hypothetical protein
VVFDCNDGGNYQHIYDPFLKKRTKKERGKEKSIF